MDSPSQLTHGATRNGTRTPEHRIWSAMLERCENPKSKSFRHYGAVGRTVCERWHIFANFLSDMGNRPSPKHTIERKDNNSGYSPENCRWATQKEQMRNISTNRLLTYNGRTLCVTAWAEEIGMSPMRLFGRINSGWSTERALTTP